ncbi:MAG: hypothetical protein WC683_02665 [bacterium]
MNLTYVEKYLTDVERDGHGWPKGLPEEERVALTKAVRSLLSVAPGMAIGDIYRHLRDTNVVCQRCPVWSASALADWSYACVHRALLMAGAHEVWRLGE